jgi:hypothetical protein
MRREPRIIASETLPNQTARSVGYRSPKAIVAFRQGDLRCPQFAGYNIINRPATIQTLN